MPFLRVSVRFPGSAYHGRGDGGEPEWPPSPLRLFQALAAAAVNGGGCALPSHVDQALRWLERQLPPTIVAPQFACGTGYRLSVPNNAMDIVAWAWSRGTKSTSGDASPATHRTMKAVRPTYVEDGPVHFLWPVADGTEREAAVIASLARQLVALGWGIDLVVADGATITEGQASALVGQRWTPRRSGEPTGLRVPVAGSLDDILRRHGRFLTRLQANRFDPPPPLTEYSAVTYQSGPTRTARSVAVFSLLNLRGERYCAFDPARRALSVAAMTRHAAKVAADRSGWPEGRIHEVVLGHGERRGEPHAPVGRRFAYVPLPSIERRSHGEVVGSVRRVMIVLLGGEADREIAWARQTLPGQTLVSEGDGRVMALLGTVSNDDAVTARYIRPSSTWTSVTPVVLPGYDDPAHYRRRLARGVSATEQHTLLNKLSHRTDSLIRKAMLQAGFSPELVEHARVEWRRVGFLPGTGLADRYGAPDHLKRFSRSHVRIEWRDRAGRPVVVAGPCVLGAGRFYGLGLLTS